MKKQDSTLISYILGILSIVFAVLGSYGITGIVLGIIGLKLNKDKKNPLYNKAKTLNKIGLILGIIIFVLSIIALIVLSYGLIQK